MSVRDLIILGSSSQQPTRTRNHGAYLLRWNEEGFLFDPGEGTQRQFIFANVAPTTVTRIFISHFHGDHCLGLGSMLMRLNLDKVKHTIHCYYPASGKKYFDRLRYGTLYHETINVVEHPVHHAGLVEDDGKFKIEAQFLSHSVENIGWRITEASTLKFDKTKLDAYGIAGPLVKILAEKGAIETVHGLITLDQVSHQRPGDTFASVIDTLPCPAALIVAKDAKMLLCESTYLETHRTLAKDHYHMTAKQAALLAQEANAQSLVLTHFSARYNDLTPFLAEAQPYFSNTTLAIDLRYIPFPR